MTIKRHGVGPRLSQAVVHGDTVYLAGMVAADPSADAKGQTQQILKKIDETLASVGSHKSKILSATVYVANMGIYGDMNAAGTPGWIPPTHRRARPSRRGWRHRSTSLRSWPPRPSKRRAPGVNTTTTRTRCAWPP